MGLASISCFTLIIVSKLEHIPIDQIYVPVKRRRTVDAEVVKRVAESILEGGQETPILVRSDEDQHRYVLLDGLHCLEACKALGETTIAALVGSAGFADRTPNYELAAAVQQQTIERLKKLRLEREAMLKTEAALQPSAQDSKTTNLEGRPTNSAHRSSV
jgi:ParB-like chromosome segregation protein Spo0J